MVTYLSKQKAEVSASHPAASPAAVDIETQAPGLADSGSLCDPLFLCKPLGGVRVISKEALINEEIREKEVRVIDEDGTQLGILPIEEAMRLAGEKKQDLVLIAAQAKPPVCKILDYGKYRYEQQKREKDARKKQKIVQIKEIRLSTFIEGHDLQVKANNAAKFLKDGDKVKVSLRFKGRERGNVAAGEKVMRTFIEATADVSNVEKQPLLEGRSLIMVLAPKNDK
ncbi:MAG: translation initiation factor IF-3 [Firmicutes bacterium]|nr:translation initiation factor IF-3 [Bacillota bacterium]